MEALKEFFLNNYLIVIIAGVILLMGLIALILYQRIRNLNKPQAKSKGTDKRLKDGNSFEDYCAELLADNGFTEVRLTPQSNDFGVDIIAEKGGVSYAFQCKYYNHPVGTRAVPPGTDSASATSSAVTICWGWPYSPLKSWASTTSG